MPFLQAIKTAKLFNPMFPLKKKTIKVILLIKTKERVNVFKSEIKRVSSLS